MGKIMRAISPPPPPSIYLFYVYQTRVCLEGASLSLTDIRIVDSKFACYRITVTPGANGAGAAGARWEVRVLRLGLSCPGRVCRSRRGVSVCVHHCPIVGACVDWVCCFFVSMTPPTQHNTREMHKHAHAYTHTHACVMWCCCDRTVPARTNFSAIPSHRLASAKPKPAYLPASYGVFSYMVLLLRACRCGDGWRI